MNKWAHLYVIACAVLGDETKAGDLVLQARTEAEMEAVLLREGPLPPVPPPHQAVVEHVALLRRRARQRRRVAYCWGAAAGLFVLWLGLTVYPLWTIHHRPVASVLAQRPAATEHPVRTAMERRIPVNRAVNQDGYGLLIQEVVIGPGYTLVKWLPQTPGSAPVPPSASPHIAEAMAESQALARRSEPQERLAEFEGLPAGAEELLLRSNQLVWWEEVTLPLTVGALHSRTGVVLERVTTEGDTTTLWLTAGSGTVLLDTRLTDGEGQIYRPARLSMSMEDSEGRWTMAVEVTTPPGADLSSLRFRVMREQPPLEIRVAL